MSNEAWALAIASLGIGACADVDGDRRALDRSASAIVTKVRSVNVTTDTATTESRQMGATSNTTGLQIELSKKNDQRAALGIELGALDDAIGYDIYLSATLHIRLAAPASRKGSLLISATTMPLKREATSSVEVAYNAGATTVDVEIGSTVSEALAAGSDLTFIVANASAHSIWMSTVESGAPAQVVMTVRRPEPHRLLDTEYLECPNTELNTVSFGPYHSNISAGSSDRTTGPSGPDAAHGNLISLAGAIVGAPGTHIYIDTGLSSDPNQDLGTMLGAMNLAQHEAIVIPPSDCTLTYDGGQTIVIANRAPIVIPGINGYGINLAGFWIDELGRPFWHWHEWNYVHDNGPTGRFLSFSEAVEEPPL